MVPATNLRSSKREKRRADIKEDVKHLLEEVWDFFPEESFYKIFTKYSLKGMSDIINLPKEDLKLLKCKDDNGDDVYLTPSEVGRIRSLSNYDTYRQSKGDWPAGASELRYNTISIDDWEDFIHNPTSTRMLAETGNTTSNPPPGFAGSSKASSRQLTPVESFKRSIKRDSSQFTNFKEGKYWDTWRRNALATARAQDIDDVLDPEHSPSTQEERNLFSEKQKFMCSVFSTTLQTDRGKKFVREHEKDFDAQMVYSKLHK